MESDQSQSEKFKQAARELECDPDEARWDKTVAKIVKSKPPPEDKPAE